MPPPPSGSSSSLKAANRSSRSLLVPLRGLAGVCHRRAYRPPEVCCSEEIENRLAAPLVGGQLRDVGAVPVGRGAL